MFRVIAATTILLSLLLTSNGGDVATQTPAIIVITETPLRTSETPLPTTTPVPTIIAATATRTSTNTATPTHTATPLPTYTPVPGANDLYRMPVIPNIDAAMQVRLQRVLNTGVSLGNRPNVFAQVGDSITESGAFLKPIGCNEETLAEHQELAPVIDYFRAITMPVSYGSIDCGHANSFNRKSVVAMGGWRSWNSFDLATVAECPILSNLECEIKLIKPGFAIIMFGSNDLLHNNPEAFRASLSRVVEKTLMLGTIPILSTIPPRYDHAELDLASLVVPHNLVIVDVAQKYQVPLLNYWLAMQSRNLVNYGLRGDGVHPNSYDLDDSTNFSSAALLYGFNIRNLTALQALGKVKDVVIDAGSTDSPMPALTPRSTAIPVPFSDVAPSDYFYQAVQLLVARGAVSGYADDTFRPYNNATRTQLAKIVVTANSFPIVMPDSATFRDVAPDNPFFGYVETAAARGLISGYSCGDGCLEFRPFVEVTRGQLAKIIVRAAGWPLTEVSTPTFSDVLIDNPFYAFIETAVAHNIISGYDVAGGKEFRPGANATRGQIAKIVYGAVPQ